MLRAAVAHSRWSRRTSAGRQTSPRRHYRKITRQHVSAPDLLARCRHRRHAASTEVGCVYGGESAPDVVVVNVCDIRETRPAMQRREASKSIYDINAGD